MVWSKTQPPAAQSGGRNAHQNRQRPQGRPAHGIHNLDQETRATGQIGHTYSSSTLIAQRVKELRNQIAMRGMNLNRLEAGGHRTARRRGERARPDHESHPRTARAAYATHPNAISDGAMVGQPPASSGTL